MLARTPTCVCSRPGVKKRKLLTLATARADDTRSMLDFLPGLQCFWHLDHHPQWGSARPYHFAFNRASERHGDGVSGAIEELGKDHELHDSLLLREAACEWGGVEFFPRLEGEGSAKC